MDRGLESYFLTTDGKNRRCHPSVKPEGGGGKDLPGALLPRKSCY